MNRPFPEMAVHDPDAVSDDDRVAIVPRFVMPCVGCHCPVTDCSCDYGPSFHRGDDE